MKQIKEKEQVYMKGTVLKKGTRMKMGGKRTYKENTEPFTADKTGMTAVKI